jgi:hypothetical protein
MMSPNPDFEYDVFISYTHVDDEPLIKGHDGWISMFQYSLDVRLKQLLKGDPKRIWWDKRLKGSDIFDKKILTKLQKSKILLCVISPRYLASEWCEKERQEFLKACRNNIGVRVGNKSRIFKIVKTHVPHEKHPDELRSLLGHPFYEIDKSDHHPREFSADKGSRYYQRYRDKLEDVAWEIKELIEELDKPFNGSDIQRVNPPEKTVYLAEATSDLYEVRENIRRELEQHKYTVLPDRCLPYLKKDGDFKDAVRDYLKRCKLSIHLVGNQYGLIPEGEKRSITELQNELALDKCNSNQLTRLIWIPPDFDKTITDNRQKEYITNLQNDATQIQGTEFSYDHLEGFKTFIQKTLERINNPPEEKKWIEGPTRVYVVCDQQDRETVKLLDDCLYREGFEVMLPLFEGSETELREIHQDHLCLCDAMLIYYSHANELWLRTKLNDLRKAPGYGRTRPVRARAIFITGEKTQQKEHFRTLEAQVIKKFGSFSCNDLAPFVTQIQQGEGGSR